MKIKKKAIYHIKLKEVNIFTIENTLQPRNSENSMREGDIF